MNINDLYPSKYLKAADLQGQVVTVTIERVAYEDLGDNRKPVVYFTGKSKGLVLNRTNGSAIADEFGPETDDWIGGTIELFSMRVPFQGQNVPSIRIRVPAKPVPGLKVAPNARDRAEMTVSSENVPMGGGGGGPPYGPPVTDDDEIPF